MRWPELAEDQVSEEKKDTKELKKREGSTFYVNVE